MAVLFLDPLAITLLLCLVVYVWLVWRGTLRLWFGRPDRWTVLAWPVPLLLLWVPLLAGGLLTGLRSLGVDIGDGGVGDAALYALVYVGPWVGLVLWPPRWLLPGWARQRLAAPPAPRSWREAPAGAVAALHARQGHGSLARWAWRVDAVPGCVWRDDHHLRFRAVTGELVPGHAHNTGPAFDDDAIAELQFSSDGEFRLEPPRGGWWTGPELDIDLTAVDRWKVQATRPWRHDGLLTFEVDTRQPLHLWVADVRGVADQLPPSNR